MTTSDPQYENEVKKQNNKNYVAKCAKDVCSVQFVKKRLPILRWLPHYKFSYLPQDMIAGIAVGLTAVPQSIAYAVIAGLSPEYGLYSSMMCGFLYLFFGSCRTVTVDPTAILSGMVSKYVRDYSADFAVLLTFFVGIVQLTMGALNLGFLVDFISIPVISGFTTGAALQIASAQLKAFFGLSGPSGSNFAESVYYVFRNIKTATLWDPILSTVTITMLFLLKRMGKGCSRDDGPAKQARWFISLARNAVVVVFGMILAYILKVTTDSEPLALIGDVGSGLPKIKPPPFSTVVGNETYTFTDMVDVLVPNAMIIPLVATLELVAIAKAFSHGVPVDATQELVAMGMCNMLGSFASCIPATGSFTRTAINNASGVQTPVGGVFKGILVLLSLSLLTSTFYYIPKASLAGMIMTAMYSLIDLSIFGRLWFNCKREFFVLIITLLCCLTLELEYGIIIGILMDAVMLLYMTARPEVKVNIVRSIKGDFIHVPLSDGLLYCAAEHIRKKLLKASQKSIEISYIIIDGTNLKYMDSTVATNLIAVAQDLEKQSKQESCQILLLNFNTTIKKMCLTINPRFENKFIVAANVEDVAEILTKSV